MWGCGGVLTDAIIAICNIRDGLIDRAAFSSSFWRCCPMRGGVLGVLIK